MTTSSEKASISNYNYHNALIGVTIRQQRNGQQGTKRDVRAPVTCSSTWQSITKKSGLGEAQREGKARKTERERKTSCPQWKNTVLA